MTDQQHNIDLITPEGTEIRRYRVSSGSRVVMGYATSAGVTVTDRPVTGPGRVYLVDRGFLDLHHLLLVVTDYVACALRLDACPMSRSALDADLDGDGLDLLTDLVEAS
jgi:hypothetical protein